MPLCEFERKNILTSIWLLKVGQVFYIQISITGS